MEPCFSRGLQPGSAPAWLPPAWVSLSFLQTACLSCVDIVFGHSSVLLDFVFSLPHIELLTVSGNKQVAFTQTPTLAVSLKYVLIA